MFLYTVLAAVAAVVAGIVLAVCTKKAENVTYGKLDRAGRVTNIVLILVYACAAPFYLFLGMISSPAQQGVLGVVGWMVSVLIASAAVFCGLGLGASVALRKRGKSKLSFTVQFAGVVGIALTFVLYAVFVGNLILPLNGI